MTSKLKVLKLKALKLTLTGCRSTKFQGRELVSFMLPM